MDQFIRPLEDFRRKQIGNVKVRFCMNMNTCALCMNVKCRSVVYRYGEYERTANSYGERLDLTVLYYGFLVFTGGEEGF